MGAVRVQALTSNQRKLLLRAVFRGMRYSAARLTEKDPVTIFKLYTPELGENFGGWRMADGGCGR